MCIAQQFPLRGGQEMGRCVLLQHLLMFIIGFKISRRRASEWTSFQGLYDVHVGANETNLTSGSPTAKLNNLATELDLRLSSEVGKARTIGIGGTLIANQAYSYRYATDKFMALANSTVVVTVMSPAKKKHRRDMIRATWASGTDNVFFVVSGSWTKALESEFATHGDIIWVNVEEEYLKLTVKVYAAFHAVHSKIPQLKNSRGSRYILKADDDVYVKLPEVGRALGDSVDERVAFVGKRMTNSPVLRTKHPLALSAEVFANSTFPPYCSGPTYAVVGLFLDCALATIAVQPHYIGIEDAQGGILARVCSDRKVEHRNNWLDVMKWDNQSLATHFSYFVKGEAQLASAMFRTHKMNSKTSCTTCFEDVLRTIGKTVDCGNNQRAATCELCPEGLGASQCGGDCQFCDFGAKRGVFAVTDSQCRPKNQVCPDIKPINCGGHLAETCSECSQGHGKKWCNHDCHWCKNGCFPKEKTCPQEKL